MLSVNGAFGQRGDSALSAAIQAFPNHMPRVRKDNGLWFWLLIAFLILMAAPASAQSFPALTGRVVDAANIIPPAEEAALEAKLAALEENSTRQLVIATIPSLEGYPIDDYGYRLGRSWGIGQAKDKNGILLILASNEQAGSRGPRIEVGYGLEPIMTDALSRIIISTQMMPLLRGGDVPAAINAGADAIIQQLTLPPDQAIQRAKAATSEKKSGGGGAGSVLFWLFIFFFFILPTIRPLLFGRGKRGRRYGSAPVIIWGGGSDWSGGGGSSWGSGGFSGGGGSFGGGGASGDW